MSPAFDKPLVLPRILTKKRLSRDNLIRRKTDPISTFGTCEWSLKDTFVKRILGNPS